MIKTDAALPPEPFEVVSRYLTLIDKVPPDGFEELSAFDSLPDGVGVERDSRLWAERFFNPQANPYEQQQVRRESHPATGETFDTIRHDYALDELSLSVCETVKFVLLQVSGVALPAEGPVDEAAAAIAAIAGRALNLSGSYDDPFGQVVPYQWTLQYFPPIADGSRFSTGPAADPAALGSYAERVDAGIHAGRLFFLGYKVHASGDGRLVFLSGRHWFDGKCWEPYQNISRP